MTVHASHPDIIKRLKRAAGHLKSTIQMLEDERACLDIAQQLHAVEKAITNAKRTLIHVRFSNSLIAIAGYTRSLIDGPVSIEELWTKVERKNKSTIITPSFTQFMLAVDILFCIKQIMLDNENRIMPICSIDDKLQNKES